MRRHIAVVLLACALALGPPGLGVLLGLGPSVARADVGADCFSDDIERRLAGCTALIDSGIEGHDLATALSMRALAHSLKGNYAAAIPDYDRAIDITPDFAVALNNRAWAYYKWGKAGEGLADVERSIAANPLSPHSFDTRAHIRQTLGQPDAALADYAQAMRLGGSRMVKMYQCGLAEQGLYKGAQDGIVRAELRIAMEACVQQASCDPLPADEQCRAQTS
jgi:tetratricopeptide (TPR) repeat protein